MARLLVLLSAVCAGTTGTAHALGPDAAAVDRTGAAVATVVAVGTGAAVGTVVALGSAPAIAGLLVPALPAQRRLPRLVEATA